MIQPTADRFVTTPEMGRAIACPDCGRRVAEDAAFCPFDGVRLVPVSQGAATDGDARELDVGARFGGRYRLEALLGSGGTAQVFRARDEQLGVDVALKVLRAKFVHDRQVEAAFAAEACVTRDVAHLNVCRVHGLEHIDDRLPYLVMDVCDGRPLSFWMARRCREAAPLQWGAAARCGALNVSAAASIVEQVAIGVAVLHARGWVHRDLKPDNLMVARHPFEWRVRIIDFGLAVPLDADQRDSAIAYGTPAYMSPEQAAGAAVDGRADVYSLGVVLFQLLKGRLPFEAESDAEMLAHHLNTQPPQPVARGARQALLRRLEEIALRCLQKNPAQRYPTAAALREDVRAARLKRRPERASHLSNPSLARLRRASALVHVKVSHRSSVLLEGRAQI